MVTLSDLLNPIKAIVGGTSIFALAMGYLAIAIAAMFVLYLLGYLHSCIRHHA